MKLVFDKYRHEGKMAEAIDSHLSVIDVEGYSGEEIYSINGSGQWFGNVEYMSVNNLPQSFLQMLYKVRGAKKISALASEFKFIDASLILALRCAEKTGKLILIDKPANILFKEVKDAIGRSELYENSRNELIEFEENYKSLKKADPDNKLLETLAVSIKQKRDALTVLRSDTSPKNFLKNNFIMGALNLFKGFNIEFFDEDLIIATVNKTFSQTAITSNLIERLNNIIEKSENLTIEEKISMVFQEWEGSDDFEYELHSPEESHDLWVLGSLDKMKPVDTSSSIQMSSVKPVAEMKVHILASVMASGTLGSSSQQVSVDGEEYLMKSIMLPTEIKSEVVINGEKITETTSLFKPVMGIFNLLRKEVKILED